MNHADLSINARRDLDRMPVDHEALREREIDRLFMAFLNDVYNKPKDAPVSFAKRPVWDATRKVDERPATVEEVALESLDIVGGISTWNLIEFVRKHAKKGDAEAMGIFAEMGMKFAEMEVDV